MGMGWGKGIARGVTLTVLLLAVAVGIKAGCALVSNNVRIRNASGKDVYDVVLNVWSSDNPGRRSVGSLDRGTTALIRCSERDLYVLGVEFRIGDSVFTQDILSANPAVEKGELLIIDIMPDGTIRSRHGSLEEVLLSGFDFR